MSKWLVPDRSRSRAVLIGTSGYDELTQVPAAANSLESMYRLLIGPLCGWPAECVTRIAEPRAPGDIPDQLVELFSQVKDVALFYYVGHGQMDWENQLCLGLAGSKARSERRATTGLAFEAVRRALRASPAATKVVILDCCFAGLAVHDGNSLAGTGEEVDITGLAGASGAYTLAATGPADAAWFESDTDSPLPHTHFTRAFVDAVSRGIPDAPDVLTLEPVYQWLREALPAVGKPAPTRLSRHNADSFVFARNATPRPAPVPRPAAPGQLQTPALRWHLLDLAEEASRAIGGVGSRCRVMIDVACAAARDDPDRMRRLLEECERMVSTIEGPADQGRAWMRLAQAVEGSDAVRARTYFAAYERAITDVAIPSAARNRHLRWAGTQNGRVLRLDVARTERLARAITDDSDRFTFLENAVRAVAARDPERAERLAQGVKHDPEHYGRALGAVVSVLLSHNPDRAELLARTITDTRMRCCTLAEVAASVASFDVAHAAALLKEVRSCAKRSHDADASSYLLRDISQALLGGLRADPLRHGDPGAWWLLENTERIMREIKNHEIAAYSALAIARAVSENPRKVRDLLEYAAKEHGRIQDRRERLEFNHILRDVVFAMLPVDTERAIAIALSMHTDGYRDAALTGAIRAVAPLSPERAEHLAYHVSQPENRAYALATAAAARANDDSDADAAMELLRHARRTGRAAGACAAVAAAIAPSDYKLAIKILTEDGGSADPSKGLADIAKAVMKDNPELAGEIAADIPNPGIRSRLLIEIAATSQQIAAAA